MLEWNVFIGSFNSQHIEPYNVFRHGMFSTDLKRAAKRFKDDKEKFTEEVKSLAMYYFWSKCEWEIVVDHWPPLGEKYAKKIDVYDQLKINWQRFIDYVWENRKELK